MPAQPKEYRRLPGRGLRRQGFVSVVATRTRLWLGEDHLLGVDATWYSEDYKRFYFRDIQAIVIRKTNRGAVVNLIFFGLAVLAGVAAGFAGKGGGAVFWGLVGGFFLLIMVINTIYGPTCRCHLKTAVQTEELPSLSRVRRARKVLARLRPLIAQAQGELSREEIPARMAELWQPRVEPAAADLIPPVIASDPNAPPPTFS